MSARVDLSVRTLYDQIWAYARFINEAPGDRENERKKKKKKAAGKVNREGGERERKKENGG